MVFFLLFAVNGFSQSSIEDREINKALEAIDFCMHWFGEEPYDEERALEIKNGINRDCSSAQKIAERVYRQYPRNNKLYGPLIELHDLGYFDIPEQNLKRLCLDAKPYFRKWNKEWETENPAYWLKCNKQARELQAEIP